MRMQKNKQKKKQRYDLHVFSRLIQSLQVKILRDSVVDTLLMCVLEAQKELLCCMHPGVDLLVSMRGEQKNNAILNLMHVL